MLEALMVRGKKKSSNISAPPFGTVDAGYYGVVSDAEFITGDAVAAAIKLTAGASVNPNTGWLKFAYQNKEVYISKMPRRSTLSWQDIYQAGAVYGTDNAGVTPVGSSRTQNARVTIAGKVYRVRLMKAHPIDPSLTADGGAELSDLLHKVTAGKNPIWASFSIAELGWASTSTSSAAYYNWVQGTRSDVPDRRFQLNHLLNLNMASNIATDASLSRGWRPVLELIP